MSLLRQGRSLLQNHLKSSFRTSDLKLAAVSNGEPLRFRVLEYIKVQRSEGERGVWRGCAKAGVVFRLQTDQTEPMTSSHRYKGPTMLQGCARGLLVPEALSRMLLRDLDIGGLVRFPF